MEKHEYNEGRRNFLKNTGMTALSLLFAGGIASTLESCSSDNTNNEKDIGNIEKTTSLPLKQKPIHLGYKKIVADKDVDMINFPDNKRSAFARVARCLRWKPITDAVEDRYHIPRGLLMAMMAQEGMGDPTMPNLPWAKKDKKGHIIVNHPYGDGGLGLIHIQAANAYKFGLHTLPRYTEDMCDDKHAKHIKDALDNANGNIPSLLEKDDRFHPVMAVDCAARFLVHHKKNIGNGKDAWILALARYSGRSYGGNRGYGHNVIEYRAAINNITGDGFPKNLSKSIQHDISIATKQNAYIKDKLNTLQFSIDGDNVGYEEYLTYFEESMQNFELEKYVALGDSIPSASQKDIDQLPEDSKEEVKKPKKTKSNSLIKNNFIDTHQHNSEGFTLFRYKIKKGDNALSISDAFDERDNNHGNKFKNTGNLNIVNFKGDPVKKFIPGDVVYIKAKK